MTEKDKFEKILSAVEKAETIGIYTHVSPDGDTIGSGLALYNALKFREKNVKIYCPDELPDKLKCLPGAFDILKKVEEPEDLAIAVDVASFERLGHLGKAFYKAKKTMTIDHHKSNTKFSDFTFYKECAATAEMIYDLLVFYGVMTKETAECLFAGIVTDTGCFAFPSVTTETHKIASELVKFGFDASKVIYDTYRSVSLNLFNLRNRVLTKSKFFDNGQIAIILVTQEDLDATGTESTDTEGIITSAINVRSVEVAYALTEVKTNQYKVSVRTKDYVDAAECAAVFGGGGHLRAAGFRVSGSYHAIEEKLLKVASDRLR